MRNRYYTNVSTDRLETWRETLGIHAAHFGNHWFGNFRK